SPHVTKNSNTPPAADQVDHHPGRFAVPTCTPPQGYGSGASRGAVSPDGLIYGFRPWEHIYSIASWGSRQIFPCIIPTGNMWFRLFWLGQWRKIYVDDSLPLDECGRYGGGSGTQEFGDFSPIHCLTGWLPQTIAVRKESSEKLWKLLQKLLPEWKPPDEAFVETERCCCERFWIDSSRIIGKVSRCGG
uniref:ENR1 protein n=1 Tax=Macrostomum lignano TaxID=282301 RepID=A0A1I8FME6_9PLAT